MILPYKVADSVHTHGWTVPFDRYVQLLYGVKSWLFDIDVTQEVSVEGSGSRTRIHGSVILSDQYFLGGGLPWESDYNIQQAPFGDLMTATTRRLIQPWGAVDPLTYDTHDAALATDFPDNKYLASVMSWSAIDNSDLTVDFEAFNPGGVYDSDSHPLTTSHIFNLPCTAHPLRWKPVDADPATYTCGFSNYGTSTMLVYLSGQGHGWAQYTDVATIFGSTDNIDVAVRSGEPQSESTALDLQIDGRTVTATNSPDSYPFISGYAHLTVNEWW